MLARTVHPLLGWMTALGLMASALNLQGGESPGPVANAKPEAFWSFQPIQRSAPPAVRDPAWTQTDVDRFILATLEPQGLRPSPPASRRDWARRVTLDLTGLPATPAEIAAFAADELPDARTRLVERLLASPQYGERWGRWWLDVARYADTNGQDENKVMANAWRYRDWVVRAFNANRPFDQFVVEQLAGDLLPTDGVAESTVLERQMGTGFLVLGPKMLAEQDKPKLVMDIVDEQIDTVGRVFLGLTLGCARCHDHKFDPVPARDYYALAGIFKSTRAMENLDFVSKFNERPIAPRTEVEAYEKHQAHLKELTGRFDAALRDAKSALVNARRAAGVASPEKLPENSRSLFPESTQATLAALEQERDAWQRGAPPIPDRALAVGEATPVDVPVHLRGSTQQLAKDPVPRGVLEVIARVNPAEPIPPQHSGRLELARWLVAPANPLTARVLVNRVWQAYFGEGLVRSPDNFGLRGERPSHPELLDWLAARFVDSGWDLKALHRLILASAVYQQSARVETSSGAAAPSGEGTARASDVDPDNRWLAHFPRRRLDAEAIRDGLLAVSGRLDRTMGGSLVAWKNDDYAPADEVSARSTRRTLYLPIVRDRVYDALTLFDFANPSVTTARRVPTVVSQQALFFLNSPVVRESAAALAREVIAHAIPDSAGRVDEAYRRTLGRAPSPVELARATRFLAEFERVPEDAPEEAAPSSGARAGESVAAWAALCQVLLASNEFNYRP